MLARKAGGDITRARQASLHALAKRIPVQRTDPGCPALNAARTSFRNASVVIWRSVQSKFSSVSVAPLYGFWRTFGEEPGADVDLDG